MIHKRARGGGMVCGIADAPGQALGSSIYWHATTCEACLALKPADAGGRDSIKRSHRAEGDNWID